VIRVIRGFQSRERQCVSHAARLRHGRSIRRKASSLAHTKARQICDSEALLVANPKDGRRNQCGNRLLDLSFNLDDALGWLILIRDSAETTALGQRHS
jgi:hypothetical protein